MLALCTLSVFAEARLIRIHTLSVHNLCYADRFRSLLQQRNHERNDVLGKPSIKTSPRDRALSWDPEDTAPEEDKIITPARQGQDATLPHRGRVP